MRVLQLQKFTVKFIFFYIRKHVFWTQLVLYLKICVELNDTIDLGKGDVALVTAEKRKSADLPKNALWPVGAEEIEISDQKFRSQH